MHFVESGHLISVKTLICCSVQAITIVVHEFIVMLLLVASSSGSCEIHLPSKAREANLNPRAVRGLKTVEIAQETRLITGTAVLQPLKFILSSSLSSEFCMHRSLVATVPSFSPHCPPTPPHPLHHPSLFFKYPFLPPCFFPPLLFLLISYPRSVLLSPPLSLSLALSRFLLSLR